jgi:23S rRNA (cytidine2498-2'-O)-methyltransferase
LIAFPIQSCYLEIPGFEDLLKNSISGARANHGRLVLSSMPGDLTVPWHHNLWLSPQVAEVSSISQAAKLLKSLQRSWAPFFHDNFRRMSLIQEQLPKVLLGPQHFPAVSPPGPLGAWTLLSEKIILYSQRCTAKFPNGEIEFVEDKLGPPNRAYLKIWEALSQLGKLPNCDDTCLELGASPGGWTWVIGRLAGRVHAIDRAPLAPDVSRLASVNFIQGDAFRATPDKYPDVTWLISDIICYPEKLLEFIDPWLQAPQLKFMILTLKFQGDDGYGIIEKFRALPGATILHLNANKHELTFFWERAAAP